MNSNEQNLKFQTKMARLLWSFEIGPALAGLEFT